MLQDVRSSPCARLFFALGEIFLDVLHGGTDFVDGFSQRTWRAAETLRPVTYVLRLVDIDGRGLIRGRVRLRHGFSEGYGRWGAVTCRGDEEGRRAPKYAACNLRASTKSVCRMGPTVKPRGGRGDCVAACFGVPARRL